MSVRTDKVELIISVNGNDAQNKLNDLRKKASDLKLAILRMTEGTEEFIKANADLTSVKAEMDKVTKSLDLANFSYKELAQQRRKLTAILNDRTDFGSKEYLDYSNTLKNVIARQKELEVATKGFQQVQAQSVDGNNKLITSFEHLGLRVLEYLGIYSAIDIVKDFFTSTIEEANKAEQATTQLKNALENAGRSDLFDKFAASAENFAEKFKAINPNDIKSVFTKLIDYGKLTETQINQLTEVIINYAAKQNITIEESTDVMTRALEGNVRGLKTYGINVAAAHTVTERFGLIVDDLGQKVKGAETVFENTNKGALAVFKENFVKIKEAVGGFLESLTGIEAQSHKNAVAAKQEADEGQALIDRYEQLSKKVNQTTADKTELKTITAQLVGIFGDSVVSINKETGALQLNVQATEDLIKQKVLLANSDASSLALKINELENENKARVDNVSKNTAALKALGEAYGVVDKNILDFNKDFDTKDLSIFFKPGTTDLGKKIDEIFKLRTASETLANDYSDAADKVDELTKKLKEFGFTEADVNKLFHPVIPNSKIIGGGNPNADAAAAKEAQRQQDELLKQAQEFRKKIDELVFKSGEVAKTQNQKEIDDVKHKYDEILKDYDALVKKLNANGNVKGLEILGSSDPIKTAEKAELAAVNIKQQKEALTKAYDDQKITTQQFFDDQKEAQSKRFVDGEIGEKVYLANIAHIDEQAKQAQLGLAETYSKKTILVNGKEEVAVKEAVTDVTKFTKEQLDQRTKDLIAAYRAQEAERKLITELDNASATSKIQTKITIAQASGDTEGQLKAQKELIDEEARQNKAALEQKRIDTVSAINETGIDAFALEIKINQEINDAKADQDKIANAKKIEADKAAKIAKIELYKSLYDNEIAAASSVLDVIGNLNARQDAKDKKKNDEQAAIYKKQLDNKLITQKKYDSLIAKQNEEAAKKKHEQDVKLFKKKQLLSITEALIDGTLAIEETWVKMGGFPTALPFVAAMGAATLANIAVIATQSPPEAGQGKLLSDGPYHKDKEKGLHVVNPRTGKVELLLEKDEMVIKGDATRSNQNHTITGTPAQIGSKINSMYGGVSWAPGAHVEQPKWRTTRPPAINYNMPKIMEQGGIVRPLVTTTNTSVTDVIDISSITDTINRGNELLQNLIDRTVQQNSQPIKTYVTIKDVNTQQAKYDAAQKASGIN